MSDDSAGRTTAVDDGPSDRERRARTLVARFVGLSVGVAAVLFWIVRTGDPITAILAGVPIAYLGYRSELALLEAVDVRLLELFSS